ncbi:hypothetical protein QW131_00925 [Roseibium salinum]|nr:hypothetical protein [Roseibium salinum]
MPKKRYQTDIKPVPRTDAAELLDKIAVDERQKHDRAQQHAEEGRDEYRKRFPDQLAHRRGAAEDRHAGKQEKKTLSSLSERAMSGFHMLLRQSQCLANGWRCRGGFRFTGQDHLSSAT